MSDECDLETLTAMLDEDSDVDEEVLSCQENANTEIAGEPPSVNDEEQQREGRPVPDSSQDSSDDDIDDDELEKLASLVENVDSCTPSTKLATPQTDDVADGPNDGQSNMEELLQGMEDDGDDQGDGDIGETSEADENDDLSQEELEMKLMEEKIKLMQAQLKMKKQQTAKKTPSKIPEKAATSNTKNHSSAGPKMTIASGKTSKQAKHDSGQMVADIGRVVADIGNAVAQNAKPRKSSGNNKQRHPSLKQGESSRKLQEVNENIFFDNPSSHSHARETKATSGLSNKSATTSFYGGSKSVNINGQEETKETLFGHDSDSDWEDLDGEKSSNLSKAGASIDRILKKGPRDRVAHQPNCNQPPSQLLPLHPGESAKSKSWKAKPSAASDSIASLASLGTSSSYSSLAKPDQDKGPVEFDLFSGLRIINPLVSSQAMKTRMEGKKLIKMSKIHANTKSSDLDGDWVTIGVLVSKSEPKMSSKGKQFSIWTMSDLADCDKPVKIFLFGDVHKEHWKMVLGSVVGLLNPSIMQNSEKYQNSNEVCITVDHGKKVMPMGRSKDLSYCKGRTKAGKDCRNFINIQQGDYCSYHVQSAYKKTSAKRAELQAGYTGVVPKSFEQKLFPSKNTCYNYGGMTITTGPSKPKNQISLNKLANHNSKNHSRGKVTTMSLHDIRAEDQMKMREAKHAKAQAAAAKDQAFLDMLATPTVGSLNLVKHIVKKEGKEEVKQKKDEGTIVQSVSAADLIKQHKQEMNQKKLNRKRAAKSATGEVADFSPRLGRGLNSAGVVDLDLDFEVPKQPRPQDLNAAMAKRKAMAVLQKNGPLKKEDPNAVKKLRSPDSQLKVKKRIAEMEDSGSNSEQESQPPKKRSRLLGDLDLDDPTVQKMLKAKSTHQGALTEVELEKQEQYFDILEKKEKMEEKMSSITKQACKAVSCKQCGYTAQSAAERCRREGHKLIIGQATKKFFKCKQCGNRTITLDRIPTGACSQCGGTHWEKASMLKEKKGPTLPSEELLLRGREEKYLH